MSHERIIIEQPFKRVHEERNHCGCDTDLIARLSGVYNKATQELLRERLRDVNKNDDRAVLEVTKEIFIAANLAHEDCQEYYEDILPQYSAACCIYEICGRDF